MPYFFGEFLSSYDDSRADQRRQGRESVYSYAAYVKAEIQRDAQDDILTHFNHDSRRYTLCLRISAAKDTLTAA